MKRSHAVAEIRGEEPPGRKTFPHWLDLRVLVPLLLAPIFLGGAIAWLLPLIGSTRAAMARPEPAKIDGDRAYGYLKQICALGRRPAGSEANARQRRMVAEHFQKHGATISEQKFSAFDQATGEQVKCANLIGSWFPERTERVVIGAHYDTRPYPDRERDLARMKEPFLGANDGASGVALLMEIAHHLKDSPTPWGVDLVLFDAEELVYGANAPTSGFFLGSKEFARRYKAAKARSKARYTAGLVLDMVGDKDLQIPKEGFSVRLAPKLVRSVWDAAKALDSKVFLDEEGQEISDDHLPLNGADIPTIDIIDFDYPEWHTAGDLPERCSGESLAEVGRVVTGWLSLPKPTPKKR